MRALSLSALAGRSGNSSARETALGRAHCSASSSAGAEAAHRIFACVSLRLLVLRKLWHLVIRHVQQAADPSQELLSKHVCLLLADRSSLDLRPFAELRSSM